MTRLILRIAWKILERILSHLELHDSISFKRLSSIKTIIIKKKSASILKIKDKFHH